MKGRPYLLVMVERIDVLQGRANQLLRELLDEAVRNGHPLFQVRICLWSFIVVVVIIDSLSVVAGKVVSYGRKWREASWGGNVSCC